MAALLRTPLSSGIQFASRVSDVESIDTPFGKSMIVINDRRMKQSRSLSAGLIVRGSDQSKRGHVAKASQESDIQPTTLADNKLAARGQAIDGLEVLKNRFHKFKESDYLANSDYYKKLAQGQDPKYFIVACCDSRVCPTKILGIQPGEAFTVRNIANLVPPYEHGPSETTSALEFAASLPLIRDILVIGHSKCGGINALMQNDGDYGERIEGWLSVAKSARLTTKAAYGYLNFDKQCQHCEMESVNSSLLNLLTYPWIEKKVNEGKLNLHGGYYNFIDCSFEYWTLDYRQELEGGSKYGFKNHSVWR
ncbi:beta carbonic anhydrase 5 [Carex littledalei]|uniref:Carbonic anhydrase n=1 Tax=Carex littledalei TaxID=544730 RepID=A0A833VRZ2_9POAL|nr:beta carbonic anhydrase 5 [Carex littledalei]